MPPRETGPSLKAGKNARARIRRGAPLLFISLWALAITLPCSWGVAASNQGAGGGDDQLYQTHAPPLVLLVMGRNHKLYYEAYNDATDLDGDGTLEVGYQPSIDYYGYFDSHKTYVYNSAVGRFEPRRITPNKKVPSPNPDREWSGDFLNYLTMSRMDVLRKVLYGGYRSTDTATETVLERVFIPQDAHSWGKEYGGLAKEAYDIRDYTPLDLPEPGTRHLFASTTLADGRPLLRVAPNNVHRIWEWVAKERPVANRAIEHPSGGTALHPGHPQDAAQYEALVLSYAVEANKYGSGPPPSGLIQGQGNPWGPGYLPYDGTAAGQNHFLTIFTGQLYLEVAGDYRFALDGDAAVELLIDGRVVAGWYGDHGTCGCKAYDSGLVYLASGAHRIEFRHEAADADLTDASRGDRYELWWMKPGDIQWEIVPARGTSGPGLYELFQSTYVLGTPATPASQIQDYEVRVKVADPSVGLEENTKAYPSGYYKPIGILQEFGEPGRMHFGLLTGSYTKNTAGGVLRKPIGPISDEIDPVTGQILVPPGGGIIHTINKLRISQFRYTDYAYEPGWPGAWVTTRPMMSGEFPDWGNPVGEMMYEGLRYFAGKGAPSDAFHEFPMPRDAALGLPDAAWDDPYSTHDDCSRPFMLVLSDIYPTYDSDQLPGSRFPLTDSPGLHYSTTAADLPALDVGALGDMIWGQEGEGGARYIGQEGTRYDGACVPKDVTSFGDVRGLCPEEPTKQGSYYAAGVAYFGRTRDINPAPGEQRVRSYMVALASPLPRIDIRVGTGQITLVPFAKSVGGCLGIDPAGPFQPTNTIVDFFVEEITPAYGRFRINYEDVEQAADHDQDAIAIYTYQVVDELGNPVQDPRDGMQVRITLLSQDATGCIIQHIGYIISGTTTDGTYLEVRDQDTGSGSDVDYFLDTPPGVTPPATPVQWGDGQPLPLSTTRLFWPGSRAAATLLRDPLWYAAKWGGFNDTNQDHLPDTAPEWDEDGDGVPDTYFYVVNPLKLQQQLYRSFVDILSRGHSQVAPVVSVDGANRTQSGDELYMAFFKPMADTYWIGNLKKYGLSHVSRDDCGRPAPEWTLVDQGGQVAAQCDGTFNPSTTSFWSTSADGGYVERGGVGERLKESMPGSDPLYPPASGPYYDFRHITTYRPEPFTDADGDGRWDPGEPYTDRNANGVYDGELIPFTRDHLSNQDLEVSTDLERYRIINYLYGYTFDADPASGNPLFKRDWILGSIIHSEPRIIDYLDETGNLLYRFAAVGSNDGMLHVFSDTDIPSRGIAAGDEIFAFVPTDLLPRLKEFADVNAHVYMVDGSANLYRSTAFHDANGNGERDQGEYYIKTLVFGERRGGRSYWALDVTDPDPSRWSVRWHVQGGVGGTEGFQELGYSWSKPHFATIRTAEDTFKEVAIFAGGYDPLEDGFPEEFHDTNHNGRWDFLDTNGNGVWDPGEVGEPHGVTEGGTGGYDKWNPDMDRMGRALFVVDLYQGTLLFRAQYGPAALTKGTRQVYDTMTYCFPADLSIIPLSREKLLIYGADIYGQIWKLLYDYRADTLPYGDPESTKWRLKRIFQANPGSTLPSGSPQMGLGTLNGQDAGRKTFFSPDVSYFGNAWTPHPVLYFGTGDLVHPQYKMVSNRFYAVTDTDTLARETDLMNLTCDELDLDADVDGDGDHDADDVDRQKALRDLLSDQATGVRGLYRVLDRQGACADDRTDHDGEQVLSQPTLFFENLFFSSYQADTADPCHPTGNAFVYALDFSWFTAGLNFLRENDVAPAQTRDLRDTYRPVSGSGIPSGIRVITRGGKAAGLMGGGGTLGGAGEEGSTRIPGPPAGVSPLFWLTE